MLKNYNGRYAVIFLIFFIIGLSFTSIAGADSLENKNCRDIEGTITVLLSRMSENTIPLNKSVHILYYSQPKLFKIAYSAAMTLICGCLFLLEYVSFAGFCIRKMSQYGWLFTMLGLALGLLYFSINRDVASALPSISLALMSSFTPYFLETTLEDFIFDI